MCRLDDALASEAKPAPVSAVALLPNAGKNQKTVDLKQKSVYPQTVNMNLDLLLRNVLLLSCTAVEV